MNIKGLEYKTVWLEYPEIEPTCKELGVAPTGVKADGSPRYTVPFIQDDATGVVMSESIDIVAYLDRTYPDTPTIIPQGTKALHLAFRKAAGASAEPLRQFVLPATFKTMTPVNIAFYANRGITPEAFQLSEEKKAVEWAKAKDGLGKIDQWMEEGDKFVMGDTISFADVLICAFLRWGRISWGEDSDEWKDVTSWQNGRWGRLMKEFEKYETVL